MTPFTLLRCSGIEHQGGVLKTRVVVHSIRCWLGRLTASMRNRLQLLNLRVIPTIGCMPRPETHYERILACATKHPLAQGRRERTEERCFIRLPMMLSNLSKTWGIIPWNHNRRRVMMRRDRKNRFRHRYHTF